MKDDEEFERFIMQRSTEKVKCFIRDKEVGRERLRDDVQNLRNVEKYLEQLERLDINRALILALFNADIYKREDFEGPDKLQALRERLVSAGYGAEARPGPGAQPLHAENPKREDGARARCRQRILQPGGLQGVLPRLQADRTLLRGRDKGTQQGRVAPGNDR